MYGGFLKLSVMDGTQGTLLKSKSARKLCLSAWCFLQSHHARHANAVIAAFGELSSYVCGTKIHYLPALLE
jgi:hypothetical protein